MRYPLPNNLVVWMQTRPANISGENNETNATQHARVREADSSLRSG